MHLSEHEICVHSRSADPVGAGAPDVFTEAMLEAGVLTLAHLRQPLVMTKLR